MLSTKNVLVTTGQMVAVVIVIISQCCLMDCINAVEQQQQAPHHQQRSSVDDFKNKDMLHRNLVPDVSSLLASYGNNHQKDSLSGFMQVWTKALQASDEPFRISNGKYRFILNIMFIFFYFYFI